MGPLEPSSASPTSGPRLPRAYCRADRIEFEILWSKVMDRHTMTNDDAPSSREGRRDAD